MEDSSEKIYYSYFKISADREFIGTFIIKLHSSKLPITISNFISLCKGNITPIKSSKSFPEIKKSDPPLTYKYSIIHKIIPNFMIHMGDITKSDGTGGKSIYGYKFNDENLEAIHDRKGLVGMANIGPDTNGSQFYITLKACKWLDGRYVIFGEIEHGIELLESIGKNFGSNSGLPRAKLQVIDCGVLEGEDEKNEFLKELGNEKKERDMEIPETNKGDELENEEVIKLPVDEEMREILEEKDEDKIV